VADLLQAQIEKLLTRNDLPRETRFKPFSDSDLRRNPMTQYAKRNETGFELGQENWAEAAEIAEKCSSFVSDAEEEQIAEEPRSCYNCRFRRWTARSFLCLAAKSLKTGINHPK
jgi:hypothetical protein